MSSSYTEKDIEVVDIDVERIKKRPDMYIGYSGWKGMLHLLKEVLQNSLDEYMAERYDEIFVSFDEKLKEFMVEDQGRGVPQGSIIDICTKIQSSGKFDKGSKKAYKISAGKNGVGITCSNALSDYFIMSSVRGGKDKTIRFEYGYPVKETETKVKSNKTGTTVILKPSESVFGKVKTDYKDVLNLCETMSYLTKGKIKVHIETKNGKDVNETFKSKNGIVDLLEKLTPNRVSPIIHFSATEGDPDKKDYKECEVALTYAPADMEQFDTNDDDFILSYSNYCTTIEHGTHVIGFKQGIGSAISAYVKEQIFTKKDENLNLTQDDCRNGLVAIVVGNHIDPYYIGQVKEKLGNEDMIKFLRYSTMNYMKKWLKENDKHAKTIGNYIKEACKNRNKSLEVKRATIKKDFGNFFSKDRPKNLKLEKSDKPHPILGKEIFIIEGESAGGTASTARDFYQALFYLRGVPKNVYGLEAVEVSNNVELKGLVTAFGAGMGKNFNINDIRYNKIIIMSDADVDGYNITSVLCAFFVYHMPQIVEAGLLYKVEPPLYRIIKNGKEIFINDKRHYAEFIREEISKSIEVKKVLKKETIKLKDSDIEELILETDGYHKQVTRLSSRYMIHPLLLESIIYYIDDLKKLEKKYEFIKVEVKKDETIIKGTFNKEMQYVKVNKKFFEQVRELGNIMLKVQPNGEKFLVESMNKDKISLYQLLDIFNSFEPANKQRFKGLGEMKSEELWETTMNPEKRNLVRLTMKDLKAALEGFRILHEKNPKGTIRDQRRALVANFKIKPEEIEN